MNVSVPGGCQIPPDHHHKRHHDPKDNIVDRLKSIFKSAVLLASDVRTIWVVIEWMKDPKNKKLERKMAGDLQDIAEGRPIESEHKDTLYDAAEVIINKANEEE